MSMLLDATVAEQEPTSEQTPTRSRLKWQWEHLGLGGILLLAGFLGLWNLTVNNYSNEYYAAAVRSMIQSWHNFFFVSFDPGGFVTVDKPPVAFWVQAAFAKVLGFNVVSLLLPEALAGIAGVFLLYYMVKRAFGAGAGLLAGLFLAVTPIWVVMNRDNNPDSILVFTLLLAAWALSRAAEKGKIGWVILSGVLVGVAFNVKMLEAYVVLPAFYAMYFLFARTSWRKRVVHLVLASLVIAAVSFSWAAAVDLTPASQRPYVDSSSVNSEMDLIINYNGLGRVDGNERATPTNSDTTGNNTNGQNPPSASGFGNGTNQPPSGFGPGTDGQFQGGPGGGGPGFGGPGGGGAPGFGGQPGATRLLTPQNGGEFGWFMPLAILGMIYLAVSSFFGMAKGEERSRRLQSVMLWGGWLLIYGVIFSFSKGVFHNYYLTIMAPAQAALAGSALVMLWRSYRRGGWQGWLLPVGLAATAFYQAYLLTGYTTWNQWLSPALIVVGLSAAAGLVLARIWRAERAGRGLAIGVAVATTAALLVVPTVWSIRAVFTALTGSIVSGTPSGAQGGPGGPGGFGNESSTDTVQTWWSFISSHLGGQLWLIVGVVGVAALLVALRYARRQQPRWFSLPVASALLLVFLVVSSGSWWIGAAQAQTTSQTSTRRDGGFGGPGGPGGGLSTQMVSYLQTNQDGYKYLVAVSSSQSASSVIIETGQPVMAIGGFSGSDNTITSTAQLEQMIANHTVRYFLIGGDRGGPGGNGSSVVNQYVTQQCKVVDSSAYSSTSSTTTSSNSGFGGGFGGFGGQSQQLYVCGS